MARELVKTYPFLSDDKAQMFKPEREALGSCPRCGSPVYEGKKNYYCSNKECIFTMWKNDHFFEERKVAFTPKIAAALLKSGKVNVKKLYSPKTGKIYDGTIVLADTGGKYVNYRKIPAFSTENGGDFCLLGSFPNPLFYGGFYPLKS